MNKSILIHPAWIKKYWHSISRISYYLYNLDGRPIATIAKNAILSKNNDDNAKFNINEYYTIDINSIVFYHILHSEAELEKVRSFNRAGIKLNTLGEAKKLAEEFVESLGCNILTETQMLLL